MYNKRIISACLILSSVLLGSLIPGGSIETRSFGHIDPVILAVFNTFLTMLGILSFILIYFILRNKRWAFIASALSGLSYFGVYVLDLGTVFPISPDPMPQALFIIEWLGTIVSIPLMFLSIQGAISGQGSANSSSSPLLNLKRLFPIIGLITVIGIGIIAFATLSAMS